MLVLETAERAKRACNTRTNSAVAATVTAAAAAAAAVVCIDT
jgi:hypothetical protein